MLHFILLFCFSFAEDADSIGNCPVSLWNQMKLGTPALGVEACEAAYFDLEVESIYWCDCFQWIEPRDIVAAEPECKTRDDISYTIQTALNVCTNMECQDVQYESLCISKHCTWDSDLAQCSDNEECKDEDALVAAASAALDVPWIRDCGMLLAVMEYYHSNSCDDKVTAMIGEIQNIESETVWAANTTLRDICCQTCYAADKEAPYIFLENGCTDHASCNDDTIPDSEIDDYFCADCNACKAVSPEGGCGICGLTNYNASVCVPMTHCTSDKTLGGTDCDSELKKVECKANQAQVSTIPACNAIYPTDGSTVANDIIEENACDCFTDPLFPNENCVWTYEHLYTLQEEQEFCNRESCAETTSEYACRSTEYNCVWLPRLVKGECVDHPCYDVTTGELVMFECDECQVCESDERGHSYCEFNYDKLGDTCDDEDSKTNKDICNADAGRCIGEVDIADLLETKELGVCLEEGFVYSCVDSVMTIEIRTGGSCENQTISDRFEQTMDNTCSNVITNDAFQEKYYFWGNCNDTHATRYLCTQEEYFNHSQAVYEPYTNPCRLDYGEVECGVGQIQVLFAAFLLMLIIL